MVDTLALGASGATRGGSSPLSRTITFLRAAQTGYGTTNRHILRLI